MANGYDMTYESLVYKLAHCDFDEAAARLGFAPPVGGIVKAHFLGREYEISSKGVFCPGQFPAYSNERSILIYYITSKGNASPLYSYRLLRGFIPGPLAGGDSEWMTAPLVRKFENDYAGFATALKTLGAVFEASPHEGEYIWSYTILPKIPMQIIYVEDDDDFPCEIKLMLDNSAGKFMEFEQLAFLCGCFVQAI